MVIKDKAIPAPSRIAGSLLEQDKNENIQRPTGINKAPTVFTSQISVFGPVTTIKL
jgi:hypothetical protein